MLVLMTDGVLEAGSPSTNQFGLERATAMIRANRNRSARENVAGLCDAVRAFCGEEKLQDDVTVVVVKFVLCQSNSKRTDQLQNWACKGLDPGINPA